MALVYTFTTEQGFDFATYNGYPFYRSLEARFKDLGLLADESLDLLIEAFETVVNDTVLKPIQYLIENDKSPWFNLTILSILSPLPEVLGAATCGYVHQGPDGKSKQRHNLGMHDYILHRKSNDEKHKWTKLHWERIRNPLSHSITANYIWLESPGGRHQVDEVNGNFIAHIDPARWTEMFKAGFELYIHKVRDRYNGELRNNFRKYITQQEDTEKE